MTTQLTPIEMINPSLYRLSARLTRADRNVLAIVASPELNGWQFRTPVHEFFKEQLNRLPADTLYVSDADPGPGSWGHKIAYTAGIHEHVLFDKEGRWRQYYAGEVVKTGGWLDRKLRANRESRVENMLWFTRYFKLFKCYTGCIFLGAKGGDTRFIRQTMRVAEEKELPFVSIRFTPNGYSVVS